VIWYGTLIEICLDAKGLANLEENGVGVGVLRSVGVGAVLWTTKGYSGHMDEGLSTGIGDLIYHYTVILFSLKQS